jgi:hypothetical protein
MQSLAAIARPALTQAAPQIRQTTSEKYFAFVAQALAIVQSQKQVGRGILVSFGPNQIHISWTIIMRTSK